MHEKWLSRGVLNAFSLLVMTYLAFPLWVLIASSFTASDFLDFPPAGFSLKWYARLVENAGFLDAAWVSLKLAMVATAIAVFLGVPVALVLHRRQFAGKSTVNALFLSPLILPSIVVGVSILQFASAIGFARTFAALLVGHTILMVPYVVRTTMASLVGVPTNIEEAAQDLGASKIETFFLVTLPQIKPGIFAGGLFAFIMSWINVEASMFNSTSSLMPIPVKLFNYIQYNVDPLVAALSSVTIFAAVAAVLIIDSLIGIDKAT